MSIWKDKKTWSFVAAAALALLAVTVWVRRIQVRPADGYFSSKIVIKVEQFEDASSITLSGAGGSGVYDFGKFFWLTPQTKRVFPKELKEEWLYRITLGDYRVFRDKTTGEVVTRPDLEDPNIYVELKPHADDDIIYMGENYISYNGAIYEWSAEKCQEFQKYYETVSQRYPPL